MLLNIALLKPIVNRYHPDILIFLVAIPFIAAFNYYLTYSNISFNWFLLYTFLIDTVQGYIAWIGVRSLIIYFDNLLPYEQGTIRRLIIQIPSTTFLGLLIISITTEMVSYTVKGTFAPLKFYTVDLIIISIWFFVINGVYVGLYFFNKYRLLTIKQQQEMTLKKKGLIAKQGKKDIQVDLASITGIFIEGDLVIASDREGKKYYLDQSLDKIEESLPEVDFFRLNRQYLIQRDMISGFKRAENGKIIILLKDQHILPQEITVSRTKAPQFKKWFKP